MLGMLSLLRNLRFVHAPIDPRDLADPVDALAMLQPENFPVRPIKVVRHVRYLLAEPI
jgi:hypothetical protein